MMNKEEKDIVSELTEKQKIFCREYVKYCNGTRAAIKAGYSEDSAAVQASENLRKPNIQAYINYLKANLAELAEITPFMVLSEYSKIAFSSIAHLHNTWIERKDFEALTEDQKACISEISTQTRLTKTLDGDAVEVDYVKIKLHDKIKGLEGINKMLGYDSPQKVELSNPDGSLSKLPEITLTIPDHLIEKLKQK